MARSAVALFLFYFFMFNSQILFPNARGRDPRDIQQTILRPHTDLRIQLES